MRGHSNTGRRQDLWLRTPRRTHTKGLNHKQLAKEYIPNGLFGAWNLLRAPTDWIAGHASEKRFKGLPQILR